MSVPAPGAPGTGTTYTMVGGAPGTAYYYSAQGAYSAGQAGFPQLSMGVPLGTGGFPGTGVISAPGTGGYPTGLPPSPLAPTYTATSASSGFTSFQSPVKTPQHEHPLVYSTDPALWMCDFCRRGSQENPGQLRFRCGQGCDYDLCGECVTKQLGVGVPVEVEEAPDDEATLRMKEIFGLIDSEQKGYISKLKFISTMARVSDVAQFTLPDVDCGALMSDERCFDAADALFETIAKGKQRIFIGDFLTHFRAQKETEKKAKGSKQELREIFDLIDADSSGSVSKLELIAAVQQNQEVDDFLLPGMDSSGVMADEVHFDRVNAVFEAIAGGRKRFCYTDFERYFGRVTARPRQRARTVDMSNSRALKRVFVVGPGYGRELNPAQGKMLENAGYQVHWCVNLPNPESPNFPVAQFLDHIKGEIDQFQPDVLTCASKGGVYAVGLWQRGYWTGPTLFINAHPMCQVLPQGPSVVLAHGANDEVYTRSRVELESLIATGTPGRCFLYFVANSGYLSNGQRSREGDRHNMASLLAHDCLPRLIDATLCDEGPEVHIVRTWRERLSDARLEAEAALGYVPELLRARWTSAHQRGREEKKLFDVPATSDEYKRVLTVFKAHPKETPAYYIAPESVWDAVRVERIQRVENGYQDDGSARPFFESLRRSMEDQKVGFEPGTHTVWAFHGTADRGAIESIVTNPVAGFQPLASGTRGASLWGSGTYFARDASYVAQGGFCGQPATDGTRQMLMCLLAVGIPCLGDPNHKGVLPFRNKPHRYSCSVDSLSSPEIYIIQHPGAGCPAYLITFRS